MSKKTEPQDQPVTAPAATSAIAQASPKKTFQDFVNSDKFKEELQIALPKHLTVDRFIRVLMTATIKNPLLLQCTQESLFAGIFSAAQAGLEIDGREAHLIPFQNHKKQGRPYEAQVIFDYKGTAKLVMNSGLVSNIHADVICDKDEFEYDKGDVKHHRINLRQPRGEAYAAYCIIRMKDGTEKCEVMTKQEIYAVRARSRAKDAGPWVTDPGEMWKKTVFKRASKWVPLSAEVRRALSDDDRDEPVNVTPKPSLAALMGAGDADDGNAGSTTPPPPAPPQDAPPVEVPNYTDDQRAAILKEVQSAMLDHGVPESRVMLHVHTEGLAAEGQDEVAALATHVLDGLRAVVPTLAAGKGGAK